MISNTTKVWLFLLGTCLVLLVLGNHWGDRAGLLIGFFLAVGLNALIFFLGESRILSQLGALRVKGRDAWGLRDKIAELSHKLGVHPPSLFIMENQTATAFSVGLSVRQPCICVSTGLLEKLSPAEIDAVLAQQLCHLNRMDSFTFGIAGVLANTLLALGQMLDSVWPPNFFFGKNQKPFLTLVSPIGWLMIRSVVRSKTYFANDLAASEMINSRDRLGEVLWKLEGMAQARPLSVPPATSHLFIVNPEGFQQKNFFLRSHPAMADRLRSLIGTPTI